MTSKQALEKLFNDLKVFEEHFIGCVCFDNKEQYNLIEKDLDVLDILKNESDSKRIIERDGIVSFHLDMILTIDNYNKIKEWLKNE